MCQLWVDVDDSVDLVISSCVLNLSPKKDEVLKEILRVLKPGGRMVISDIVVDRDVSEVDSIEDWLNAIGTRLGDQLEDADFEWRPADGTV